MISTNLGQIFKLNKMKFMCCVFMCIVATCHSTIQETGSGETQLIRDLKGYIDQEVDRSSKRYESRIEKLEETIQELTVECISERLKSTAELAQLRMEMEENEKRMQEEMQILKRQLDTKCTEKMEKVEQLRQEVKKSGEQIKGNKRQINTQDGPGVAFFARLANDTPPLSPGQDIVFNDVVTNVGGGYHSIHGTFFAPVPGIYLFTTSVLSHIGANKAAHAKLVKNGQLIAILDSSEPDGIAQASQTVIVQLDKGDDVAVQNEHYPGVVYYGYDYSTFSGFLLYDLTDSSAIVGK